MLDFEIGPELEAPGSVLDKLDYNRLRRLGTTLRNIPNVREDTDWDFPPSSLQGWVASYDAAVQVVQIAAQSGIMSVLQAKSEEIKAILSPEIIPSLDAHILRRERIEDMIADAKALKVIRDFDLEKFYSIAVSREAIARAIVVSLDETVAYDLRPKVDANVGMKRLQVGALIGKAAAGGALAVANLALGVLAGLSHMPAIVGSVSIAVGIVGSAYTGLSATCDAVEKIAATIQS